MSQPHTPVSLETWRDFLAAHAAGGIVDGRVSSVVPFGAFVEVGEGIHGLLHRDAWSAEPEIGAGIQVRIIAVDLERRRMSLSEA
jgi:ribosomal protein S1